MANDAQSLLAAGLARRARLDALHAQRSDSESAKRNARGYGGYAPHGGTAVDLEPINPRGTRVQKLNQDDSRIEEQGILDWSIISAWK